MPDRKAKGNGVDKRHQHAIEMFEKAVKAMGRKDFDRAREILSEVLKSFPEENEVAERANAYLAMCQRVRERERRTPKPKTFEDLLHYGVFLHNRGQFDEAVKTLQQATDLHPRNEHAQYCLAAAAARSGDPQAALRALRSAISANPENRALARVDGDFEVLRAQPDFQALVQSASR